MKDINEVVIDLNLILVKQHLFLPLTKFHTLGDINEVASSLLNNSSKEDKLIDFYRVLITLNYRAQQSVKFSKLSIYDDFTALIDLAYLSLLRSNPESAFFTLIPIIEGLFLRWYLEEYPHKQAYNIKTKELKEFIKCKTYLFSCLAKSGHKGYFPGLSSSAITSWTQSFSDCIEIFFMHSKEVPINSINRNIVLHMLKPPSDLVFFENLVRCFLLIDTIAELYIFEKPKLINSIWLDFFYEKDEDKTNELVSIYNIALSNSLLDNNMAEIKLKQYFKRY